MSLYEAVVARRTAAIEAALTAGEDVNQLGEHGRTPLIAAAEAGDAALVGRLLEAGAEPAWRDGDDETALLKAAANGHARVVALLGPYASDDERALAGSFLSAAGSTPEAPPSTIEPPSGLQRAAATAAARAAGFFGDTATASRLERAERSEASVRKKR
jgi:hypothetical protein